MAMVKKRAKAAEKKSEKRDRNALREKEERRESSKGHAERGKHAGKEAKGAEAAMEKAARSAKKRAAREASAKGSKGTGIEVAKDIAGIEEQARNFEVIKYPLVTEKAVNMIEAENKLVFVVDGKATKPMVKRAVEGLYKVKVNKVNIIRDMKTRKRAIVSIDKKSKASDVATKLGVI